MQVGLVAQVRAVLAVGVLVACGEAPVDADGSTGSMATTGPGPTSASSSGVSSSSVGESSTSETASSSGDETSTSGNATSTTGSETSTTGRETSTTGSETSTTGSETSTSTSGDETSTSTGPDDCTSTIPEAVVDDIRVPLRSDPFAIAAADVLANDVDVDGDALFVASADALSAAGGTITETVDGFAYTPPVQYWGEDSFAYTIGDGTGCVATGLVRIMVYPTTIQLAAVALGIGGFVIDGAAADDRAGWSVSGGGDVNGDGLADIIVGAAFQDSNGVEDSGAAYVVFGRTETNAIDLAEVSAGEGGFVLHGELVDDYAGYAVGAAGDVNGDGLADLIVGAAHADAQADDAGRVYVVFGKQDTGAVELADVGSSVGGFVIDGEGSNDNAGDRVDGAGDVNGDALADILIGAGGYGSATPAYVVFGKTGSAPVLLADVHAGAGGFAIHGSGTLEIANMNVGGAGDVNADGLADVVVGLPSAWTDAGCGAGRTHVVFGKADTVTVDLVDIIAGIGGFAIEGAQGSLQGGVDCNGDFAGLGVDGAGDIDGDGLADLVIGADDDSYVVFGKTDTAVVSLADVEAGDGGIHYDDRGLLVAGGGDIDADGVPDIVLGGASVPIGQGNRTFVAFGQSGDATIATADLSEGVGGFALDRQSGNDHARIVTMLGDVNGDGHADLGIGAWGANSNGDDSGRTYVIFGGNFSSTVTHRGTPAADVLVGTASADSIVAGRDADSLAGAGGADVLYCGSDDDVVGIVDASFARIDGGTGQDTLAWQTANATLDLSLLADDLVVGIEAIDITGTGDNALVLELRDLLWISDTSNMLTIIGDGGDTLSAELAGGGFVDLGVTDGFHEYGNGTSLLRVADAITANVGL